MNEKQKIDFREWFFSASPQEIMEAKKNYPEKFLKCVKEYFQGGEGKLIEEN